MILLGIDFGDTRTGIAKLDTRYPIATPLETVRKNNRRKRFAASPCVKRPKN